MTAAPQKPDDSQELEAILKRQRFRIEELEDELKHLKADRAHILNSTSWKLMEPVRWLGRIAKAIRGRPHILRPARLHDLISLGDGRYEATDIRPFMVMMSSEGSLPSGWVELTYSVDAGRVATPSLFADKGLGTSELDRKRLPPCEGETITTFVRLPDQVRAIRFDPINWKGSFTFPEMKAKEITRLRLALTLMMRVLKKDGTGTLWDRYRRGGFSGLKEYLARQATGSIDNYENWRDLFWTLDQEDRSAIAKQIERLEKRPTFSIVMPVYETDPELLDEAIQSVRDQLYPDWELCIADDASKKPGVRTVLEKHMKADSRVKVTFREQNGHISAASNSALELATGDYIALFDHDDLLTPDALYWMATEIISHPEADILYSDEDKVDEGGRVFDPYFKPDFSPELFLSQNHLNHLGVYRRSLVEEVGGFRLGLEGSQDYDLALRILAQSSLDKVRHVPVVLYHWRVVEGSVALGGGEKSYAHDRARQAIAEYLKSQEAEAEVVAGFDGYSHRVKPALPSPAPKVSIIIPTRDRLDVLKLAVNGLLEKTSYPNWELIIVDNGSQRKDTLDYLTNLSEDPRIRILRDDGLFNFSRLNNRAAEIAEGPLILLLNNDVEPLVEDWLDEMVSQLYRPGIGAVGAKLYFPDGLIQHVGVTVGIGGVAGHFEKGLPREANGYFNRPNLIHNVTAATAACLLTTKKIYDEVEGLNEDRLSVAFNDVDFCLKIQEAGYRIVITPYAELTHYESASRGHEDSPEKIARFHGEMAYMRERWGDKLDIDPFFNPNLHLDNESPSLGFPPRVDKPWDRFRDEK